MNATINPTHITAGQQSTIAFSTPLNMTTNIVSYTVQATCGSGETTYTISVLPTPEKPGPSVAGGGSGAGGRGGPPSKPPCGRCGPQYVGRPIDVTTGELFYQHSDLALSGPFGLHFTRSYASGSIGTTDLGAHWQHNYGAHLTLGTGSPAFFDESGLPYYFMGTPAAGSSTYDNINGLTLALNSTGTTYTVTSFGGTIWTFNTKGELVSLADRIGNVQTIKRDAVAGHNDRIISVSDPLGRQLCFFSDSQNRINGVSYLASGSCPTSLPASGTVVKMAYDIGTGCASGDQCSVTEPDGRTWTYKYLTTDPTFFTDLVEVDNPGGNPDEINTYSGFKVVQQVSGSCTTTVPCADTGNDLSFTYPQDLGGTVTIVDGENRTSTLGFDPNNELITAISGPVCACGGDQNRTYGYDTSDRTTIASDNGIDGSTKHSFTYTYGRDNGQVTYPGPTQIVENLDAVGTTRTTSYKYYPVGDKRQDLPQVTTLPSVDVAGRTMTVTDTYSTTGLLTQQSKTGLVNSVTTTYTWKWGYDSRGRLTSETGPRTDLVQTTTYAYFPDSDGDHVRAGQLQKVTDALSHATTYAGASGFSTYDLYGNALSSTDANGVTTTYAFDPQGRATTSTLLGVTGDTTNLISTWSYDTAGRLALVQKPAGNGVALAYDTSSRVTDVTRTNPAHAQQERLAVAYNANDQMTTLAAQSCTSPSAACASWTTAFNQSYGYAPTTSDLIRTTNADNTFKQFAYDAQGQLSGFNDENHPSGANYSNTYDLAGRRLTESRILAGATGGSVTTKYAYDLHDNVTSVTDPNGNTTTYHNDDFDRVTKEVSPVQGTTTYGYDPADNLVTTTDSNAATTAYTYDALDRELTEKATKAAATLTSTWTYDDATAGHFGIGRTATMIDPSGSTKYRYERRGFVVSEARQIVGKNFAQDYSYDLNGNRASIVYPDGRVVTYTYDFADRPSSATHTGTIAPSVMRAKAAMAPLSTARPEATANPLLQTPSKMTLSRGSTPYTLPSTTTNRLPGNRRTIIPQAVTSSPTQAVARALPISVRPAATSPDIYVSSASYLPFGPITSMTFGNGTVQTLSRNTRYFPKENKLVSGSATLSDHVYSEDAVGNITAISDALDNGYLRSFAYDDLNRLTTANAGTKLWGTAAGNGYAYDVMGNMKSAKLGSVYGATFAYKPGAAGSTGLPELASVVENGKTRTISYDAFGNELNDGVTTSTYSSRELLGADSTQIAAYYYDGNRQRVSTTLRNGNARDSFFDPGQHLLAETAQFTTVTPSPAIAEEYVWFRDAPVAQIDGTTTRWTFADHLATPQIQTDINGAVQWQAEYEPYGEIETLRKNDLHQPLRFPGQVSEQFDTGANGLTALSFNNGRWYHSNWGRYSQSDPLGLSAGFHLYSYALGNPEALADPLGLYPIDSQHCRDLLKKIANLEDDLSKRWFKLLIDPLQLAQQPYRIPGDDITPRLSRGGHVDMINDRIRSLQKYRDKFDRDCKDPNEPNGKCPANNASPTRDPERASSPFQSLPPMPSLPNLPPWLVPIVRFLPEVGAPV